MSAWRIVSTRHSARSASLPTSIEPISSSRPSTLAPPIVAISIPSRTDSAVGPPRARANSTACRSSSTSELASFDAAPSTPSPTGTPASRRSRVRAMPAPSRAFDDGQCATPVPVSPNDAMSLSPRWTAWANQTSGPSQPSSAMYSAGEQPKRSRQKSSSSVVSARCVWSRTSLRRASSAASTMSSRVTENGEHGATPIRTIEPGDGSWCRSIASCVAIKIASRSSTTWSGGSPPSRWPRSIDPRVGWNRTPTRPAAADLGGQQVAADAREHVVVVGGRRAAGADQP